RGHHRRGGGTGRRRLRGRARPGAGSPPGAGAAREDGPFECGAHPRPLPAAHAGRVLRLIGKGRMTLRLQGKVIGLGLTGSHCTYDEVIPNIRILQEEGARVMPVLSFAAAYTDTRFTTGDELRARLREATGFEPVVDMLESEPLGQKKTFDAFVIAPCTGNT